MNIDFKSDDYLSNIEDLKKINDIYIGLSKMKKTPKNYLIEKVEENSDDYDYRLKNSYLENYVEKSINNINSIIFRKGITIDESKVKAKFNNILINIDGEASTYNEYFIKHSLDSLIDGMSFIWVDGPSYQGETKFDVINNKAFPILKSYKRQSLINYDTEVVNGKKVLTQVVLSQQSTRKINDFESKTFEQLVVLRIGSGAIFESNGKEFTLYKEWKNNLSYIPFFTTYSKKMGYLQAKIPFLDLADMNLNLYNRQSRNNNLIDRAEDPILSIFGFEPNVDENGNELDTKLGLSHALSFPDGTKGTNGVEFNSPDISVIPASQDVIKGLQEQIEVFSLGVLSKFSFKTATEAKINDKNSSLFLIEHTESLESTINNCFRCIDDYLEEKTGIEATISKDFDNTTMTPDMISKYLDLKNQGVISIDTLWDALINGEVLEEFNREEEKTKIKNEISEIDLTGV